MYVFLLCMDYARTDKGNWSEPNAKILCDLWVDQINKGNCIKGTMTKTGYREVLLRYHAATGLVHDIKQVANRIRQLKGLWQFIRRLQNDTVLGCREDGTVYATDQWWNDNTKVLAKLLVSCLTTS